MIITSHFGTLSTGESINEYTLTNASGNFVKIINLGCRIRSIRVFGVDVCLGYDSLQQYETDTVYMGAICGRYANRIEKAGFLLNGKEYKLAVNDGPNHLHGGIRGFSARVWNACIQGDSLVLSRVSPDGEENYPGTLQVSVTYSFDNDNTLSILYNAKSDQDTIVNLTNHTYFNLNGGGTALGHLLTIHADTITENDCYLIPNGSFLPVDGTPFDFRKPKPLGTDIEADNGQLKFGHGYDQNFVLSGTPIAAVVTGDKSEISMDVITDQPGLQLYSGNFLTPRLGKNGVYYRQRDALCLETQGFPNALEHPNFPSPILRAGETYRSETRYHFYK